MNIHPTTNNFELFAFNDSPFREMFSGAYKKNKIFKVIEFVSADGLFPYGVRIEDNKGIPIQQVFHTQRFRYFRTCLN